jgi:hypothetical protein
MVEANRRGVVEFYWLAGESLYMRVLSNALRSLIWAEKRLSPWHSVVTGLIALYAKLPDTKKQMIRGRA